MAPFKFYKEANISMSVQRGISFLLTAVFFFALMVQFSGCAVVMALKQPDKKKMSVLTSGSYRQNIIISLGHPAGTEIVKNERVDTFQFRQGYSRMEKFSRAFAHGILDLFTIFIWELIAIPYEKIRDGKVTTVVVNYDSEDMLKDYSVSVAGQTASSAK